jgi:urate oxidase
MPFLSFDTYGKTRVRLTQVIRNTVRHNVTDVSVKILFEGDFARSYTAGDNTDVLPTDTIKNTVYVVARQKPIQSIEQFAADLARHFLSRLSHLTKVTVEVEQTPWTHMGTHDTAFLQAGRECRSVVLSATRANETFVSGIRDLEMLKTDKSAFTSYMKDEYTTLRETQDRLLGTVLHADWTYRAGTVDFNVSYGAIRHTLLETFAKHESLSVQHTLYAMGEAAIEAFSVLEEIHLVMPNKHRLLVDLSIFGMDNPNQIFVPTDEPSGYIEARISAGSRK